MLDRRVRRSENVVAAAQLYLEQAAERHAVETLVLASEEGFAIAGAGSEAELFVVGAIAISEERSAELGIQRFDVTVGDKRFCVGARGKVPVAECAASLARILG